MSIRLFPGVSAFHELGLSLRRESVVLAGRNGHDVVVLELSPCSLTGVRDTVIFRDKAFQHAKGWPAKIAPPIDDRIRRWE